METIIIAEVTGMETVPKKRTLHLHSKTAGAMEVVIMNSLPDSHEQLGTVTQSDVAKLIDLINYLVCGYSTIRAVLAPHVMFNGENQKCLNEKGYINSAIFHDLSIDAKILYDDIKKVGGENVAPCAERRELQKLKFISLCESFNQIWKDMVTLRLHFESSGKIYVLAQYYGLIGDKCGGLHLQSLQKYLGGLTIDYSAAGSPFYTQSLQPTDEKPWAKFWAETPHSSMVKKYVVAQSPSNDGVVKIKKKVVFADEELPGLPTSNPPAQKRPLSPSPEPGEVVLDPNVITTPKKAEPESVPLPTPPPSAKIPAIKLVHEPKFNPIKPKNTKRPSTASRPRKQRAPKSKIISLKYGKRQAKSIVNILGNDNKKSWKLFEDMEMEVGAKRQRAGRRAAKAAENKIKKNPEERDETCGERSKACTQSVTTRERYERD